MAIGMDNIFTVDNLLSLLTLTVMEIVLGIDNVLFVAIIVGKLPQNVQSKARITGLSIAMLLRVGLLFLIASLAHLMQPLFEVFGHTITAHTVIMVLGGGFLIYKSTTEIHEKLAVPKETKKHNARPTLSSAIFQIIVIDIVFSFDSILTAIGIAKNIAVMIAAVVIAMFIMLASSAKLNKVFDKHPSIKMLALAFLLVIGFLLVVDGFDVEVPRSYLYVAMAFAFGVEALNIKRRKIKRAMKKSRRSGNSQ